MDDSLGPCGIVRHGVLNFHFHFQPACWLNFLFYFLFNFQFNFLFNFQSYFLFLQTFCKHFNCLSGMPPVSHEGASAQVGEVRQAYGPTLGHFPLSVWWCKGTTQKHPAKDFFVGWELVGVFAKNEKKGRVFTLPHLQAACSSGGQKQKRVCPFLTHPP